MGEGRGGGYPTGGVSVAPPPTSDPTERASLVSIPPRASRAGGGEEEEASSPVSEASRFATSSLLPRVDARARCAAASPPERRSQELSGGGCRPVEEPRPLSPRLIAGLSNSASAGPIGCTSGRCAFELGAFGFGVLPDFLGESGVFAMTGIWDESPAEKRAMSKEGTLGNITGRSFETRPSAAPQ